jgi:hypothetical protein
MGQNGGGRRCVAPGCGRLARPGRALCRDHERGEEGRAVSAALARLGQGALRATRETEGEEERRRAAALFRRRLADGQYRALIDERLRQVLEQAAEEKGLREELGALRVVLMRLLVEEQDLDRLARGVSRVATAAARVRRVQEQVGDGPNAELQAFVDGILNALALPADEVVPPLGAGAEDEREAWGRTWEDGEEPSGAGDGGRDRWAAEPDA